MHGDRMTVFKVIHFC